MLKIKLVILIIIITLTSYNYYITIKIINFITKKITLAQVTETTYLKICKVKNVGLICMTIRMFNFHICILASNNIYEAVPLYSPKFPEFRFESPRIDVVDQSRLKGTKHYC